MTYSIIGAGPVGAALARHLSESGVDVSIANTRGPETIPALGALVTPVTLAQAAAAEVIILAVPFAAHGAVGALLADWSGKIVIDAMNSYGIAEASFKGLSSSAVVAAAFPGARLVKTFNQLTATMLARAPSEHGGERVMFLAGDDSAALATVTALVAKVGYAPVPLGTLAENARLISFGGNGVAGPLVMKNFIQHA